ncbi:MAG: DedA family protein [Nitrospirae bacterium]|nr:DedA family protein [Nitrospirota bacterium]
MFALSSVIQNFPYPGLFILPILGSLGLPVPEEAILILCGVMISKKVVEPVPAFLMVYSGVLLSDFIIFSFGKKYGRMLATHKKLHRLLPPEKLAAIEAKFKKFGPYLILFGRHLIGFRAQLFLVSGIMGIHPRTFILMDAVAAAITVSIMLAAGYTGVDLISYLDIKNIPLPYIAIILFVTLLVIYALYRHFRRTQNRNARKLLAEGVDG